MTTGHLGARHTWWAPALRHAARARGITAEDAQALSDGYHATIALPRAGLTARVARPGELSQALKAELDFAILAARHGVPVLAPADPRTTPTPHGTVSFWPLLSSTGATAAWPWLAQALSQIHQLPAEPFPHRSDPLGRIRNRLARYRRWPGARDSVTETVAAACRQLGDELARLTWPTAIVHGDAHPGNVVVTTTGPTLVDFDLAGAGPAMWDLTIPVVHHRRFGAPGHILPGFFAAYGSDPRGRAGFEVLVRMQELLCISYVLERLIAGAPAEQELATRLPALQQTGTPARWHPLPTAVPGADAVRHSTGRNRNRLDDRRAGRS